MAPAPAFVETRTVGAGAPVPPPAAGAAQEEAFRIERDRVAARRASEAGANDGRSAEDTVGLALSGGGIRSATFSLGILRAMGRAGIIPHLDYLSTVSGGGYIGAFLCSRYVPREWRGAVVEEPGAAVTGGSGDPFEGKIGEAAFEHLRQSGRYLLPGSADDGARLAVTLTRNWLAVQAVIGCSLLAVFLLLKPVQAYWLAAPAWLDREAGWAAVGLPPLLWPSAWLEGYPFGHWFIGSPLFPLAAALLFVVLALYWAYFHARGRPGMSPRRVVRVFGPSVWTGVVAALAGAALAAWPEGAGGGLANARGIGAVLALAAAIAIVAYLAAEIADAVSIRPRAAAAAPLVQGPLVQGPLVQEPLVQEDRVRARLTDWAAGTLGWAAVLGFLGLVDSLAQTLYARLSELWVPASLATLVAAAVPVLRKLMLALPGLATGRGRLAEAVRKSGRLIAFAAGFLLLGAIALFWAIVAHALAWRGGPIGSVETWGRTGIADGSGTWRTLASDPLAMLAATSFVFVTVAVLIGWSISFLNLSSYSHFYAARLRRAYLGATNADRYGERRVPVDSDQANDDVPIDRYYAPGVHAPVHLINVTVNDTASTSANTIQRDRRGKPLTVSPAGFLYPAASARDSVSVLPFSRDEGTEPEKLPLSAWIGISGAAASTGVGQYGSLGLSLLAGLANLRLGRWWDPGSGATKRGRSVLNLVQFRLADELIGRFPGTDGKRWYLTDGGHFENTGAYELVRRRVAFIVVCDCGADPDYAFGDLVTLTRRIKIDFDAELSFLDEAELDAVLGRNAPGRSHYGSLRALGLRPDGDPRIGPYAALGRIRYERPAAAGQYERMASTLLLIKPRVCGSEAIDLVAYAKANPPFPQQTTLDQFYDEAQWESHYRLGLLIGETLFARPAHAFAARWTASSLRPL